MELLIIYFACIALASGRKILWNKQCHRSDPQVDGCILDKIKDIKPKLQHEPFMKNRLYAEIAESGIKLNTTITNIVAYQGSKFTIDKLKVDLLNKQKYTGEMVVIFPHLKIEANYLFQGKKMSSTIKTFGKLKAKLNNVSVLYKCVASPVTKNGVEYLKLDSVTTKVNVETSKIDLQKHDKSPMGNTIENFARRNSFLAMRRAKPAVEKYAATIFKEYINDLLDKVPLNFMLVD